MGKSMGLLFWCCISYRWCVAKIVKKSLFLFQRVTKNENGFFLGHDMLSVRAVDVLISKKFVRQTDWREEGGGVFVAGVTVMVSGRRRRLCQMNTCNPYRVSYTHTRTHCRLLGVTFWYLVQCLQPWARAVCTFPAVPSTLRETVNEQMSISFRAE